MSVGIPNFFGFKPSSNAIWTWACERWNRCRASIHGCNRFGMTVLVFGIEQHDNEHKTEPATAVIAGPVEGAAPEPTKPPSSAMTRMMSRMVGELPAGAVETRAAGLYRQAVLQALRQDGAGPGQDDRTNGGSAGGKKAAAGCGPRRRSGARLQHQQRIEWGGRKLWRSSDP